MRIKVLLLLLLFGTSLLSIAQSDTDFNMVDSLLIRTGLKNPSKVKHFNADEQMLNQNWFNAIDIFVMLTEEEPDNYNIHFKLGYCYLKTKLQKHKAIKYLEIAIQGASIDYDPDELNERKAPYESYYFLAEAYHFNYQFGEAIEALEYLKTIIKPEEEDFRKKIDRKIHVCHNAKEIESESIPVILTHMGSGINTSFDEYSPFLSSDESMMIFTSNRIGSTGRIKLDDGTFYEDIFMTLNRNGNWSKPKRIERINTAFNEASIGLSPDGKTMFIYKAEGDNGDIYTSNLGQDGFWSKPEPMPSPINTRYRETHASISEDGQSLYFTSDRKGGFGGTDIYIVKKLPNDEWGKIINLGPEINTPLNEDAPNIMPDGKTIYFSSEGHKTMGGLDIFRSEKNENGDWEEAVNVGYPISTTEDDAFFYPIANGRTAYYSTYNTSGFGKSDIFHLTMPSTDMSDLCAIAGYVNRSDGSYSPVDITVTNYNTGKLIGKYAPNPRTGKYLMILPQGKTYKVEYVANGYYNHYENIYVEKSTNAQDFNLLVTLQSTAKPPPAKKSRDTTYISDLLFEFDQSEIDEDNLDIFAEFLKENPDAIIEIGGHTDANGPEIYNIHLSLRRAINIYNRLIEKDVNPDNLVVKGYGEKYPAIMEKIPDGAHYDTLHQYNRRVEFKVLKEGKDVLMINHIEVPPDLVKKVSKIIQESTLLADSDKDGVPDVDDGCPEDKGTVETGGCPVLSIETVKAIRQATEGIAFRSGSADFEDCSYAVLDKLAIVMLENEKYLLSISGHTDNVGLEYANLELSRTRAKAAKDYLISKGVDRKRINSAGYGSKKPITDNDTKEGRSKNRRVEFKIVY